MKIFSTEEIRNLDTYTIEHEPISSIDLMERSAKSLADAIARRFDKSRKIYVFAGQGNNGGDALALSRILLNEGYIVFTYLCNPTKKLSANCSKNKERLLQIPNLSFVEIVNEFVPPSLTKEDIIIDGLFGSGLKKSLEGGFAALVRYINSSPAYVISIDIPSGLFGENNGVFENQFIVEADLTLTLQFPKLSFLFADCSRFVGEVEVLDIKIHKDIIKKTPASFSLLEKEDVSELLRKRNRFAHKGTFGHGLLCAGSYGKMGAAVLSASACLRSGIGLLTTLVPECGKIILQTAVPESMLSIDTTYEFTSNVPDLTAYSAFALGPGIGTFTQTSAFLENFLSQVGTRPVILDADALNVISAWPIVDNAFPENCIITPHPKEFDRLVGKSQTSYERLNKAIAFAKRNKLYVILKGAFTLVACPDGLCYFNSTGNPGMATAGSGDVLTGILLALLAQGYSLKEASLLGVYLHGLAGDLVKDDTSEESLIARDIINYIGKAFALLKN